MVSVMITARNEPQLNRTIESLYKTAEGEIEVMVSLDEPPEIAVDGRAIKSSHSSPVGRRRGFNIMAGAAKGEYLFILDAHCKMSQGWDIKLAESCPEKGIVVSCIQDMHEETWELRPGVYNHVYLTGEYEEKWWSRKPVKAVEEMMCFTGCSWMIPKKYYWECGGYDESLGLYGWDGPEWACKVWMGDNPGVVLLRSDVICGHVFGTNTGNKLYGAQLINRSEYIKYMSEKYGDKVAALYAKFPNTPVPVAEQSVTKVVEKTSHTTTINKVDEVVVRNSSGKIISKKKVFYKPYEFKHDVPMTGAEVEAKCLHLITDVDHEENIPIDEVTA